MCQQCVHFRKTSTRPAQLCVCVTQGTDGPCSVDVFLLLIELERSMKEESTGRRLKYSLFRFHETGREKADKFWPICWGHHQWRDRSKSRQS